MIRDKSIVLVYLATGLLIFPMLMGMGLLPPEVEVLNGGRTISSVYSIFTNNESDDMDKDGLYDRWENLLTDLTKPEIHLDGDESWLTNQSNHYVADFVKIVPYNSLDGDSSDSASSRYIFIFHAIAWSRDYGRYCNHGFCFAHNGDVERLVMLWRVVSSTEIELDSIYTSAHEGEKNDHSGVWDVCAGCKPCNTGLVINGRLQTICLNNGVQFSNNRVSVRASEDKHALYPSTEVCEEVKLVQIPFAPDLGEDCKGGEILPVQAFHVGEQHAPFINDMSAHTTLATMFPGESIWNSKKFCGSLGDDGKCSGSIGDKMIPPRSLMRRATLIFSRINI